MNGNPPSVAGTSPNVGVEGAGLTCRRHVIREPERSRARSPKDAGDTAAGNAPPNPGNPSPSRRPDLVAQRVVERSAAGVPVRRRWRGGRRAERAAGTDCRRPGRASHGDDVRFDVEEEPRIRVVCVEANLLDLRAHRQRQRREVVEGAAVDGVAEVSTESMSDCAPIDSVELGDTDREHLALIRRTTGRERGAPHHEADEEKRDPGARFSAFHDVLLFTHARQDAGLQLGQCRPSAFARKVAIWPRVSGARGSSFPGRSLP